MGQQNEAPRRKQLLGPYAVDEQLMKQGRAGARSSCTACRPTAATRCRPRVIDGPQSVVWDEAENRLHAQKAILAWCLGVD